MNLFIDILIVGLFSSKGGYFRKIISVIWFGEIWCGF